MKNIYQQQLIDFYMKQCNNLYPSQNAYPNQFVNMLENANNFGLLRLNIIDQVDKTPIPNPTITIYVTDGMQRDIPIMYIVSTINPVRIELPISYELGTQLAGPEYDFSTYNLRVGVFGYFANEVYNIRLFPNTATDFLIEMIPISQIVPRPAVEERTAIPPHPRDETN